MVTLREEYVAWLFAGVAWLPSAHAVRSLVKSFNERNPYPMLLAFFGKRTLRKLPGITGRKVGMTSNLHGPYELGCTRPTMARTTRSNGGIRSKSSNLVVFGLKTATRLHEGGIASNRGSACRGEYVPEFCTYCPSRWESSLDSKTCSNLHNRKGSG